MSARIRHQQAPNPNGCRWCGIDPRDQRLARMTARRNARADATLDARIQALKEKP